jgi:hypothetical protein
VFDPYLVIDEEHCGSGLAREEALTGTRDIGSTTKKPPDDHSSEGFFMSRET